MTEPNGRGFIRKRVKVVAVLAVGLVVGTLALYVICMIQGRRLHYEASKLERTAQTYDDLKLAVEKYEKALAIYVQLRLRGSVGYIHMGLGNVYYLWGRHDEALAHYEKSLAIFRESKERWTRWREVKVVCRVAQVYAQQGDRGRARETIDAAFRIDEQIKGGVSQRPTEALAHLFMDEGDLSNAEPLIKKTGGWSTRARFYLLKADYDRAEASYEGLLKSGGKWWRHVHEAGGLFTAYTGLGAVYEATGENRKAAEFYQKAVSLTEKLKPTDSDSAREKFFAVRIGGFLRTTPYEGLERVRQRLNRERDALESSTRTGPPLW